MARDQTTRSSKGMASFLWRHKLWWALPLAVLVAILAVLIVMVQAGPEAPFQYPKY